ncbi:MAG: DinB family protein [Phycisphaerales bacterium]
MQHALAMLRFAVILRWESVDQVLKDHGGKALGDPLTPGTGAWHLRHIVEIFREHARVMRGDAEPDTRPIPAAPRAMRDALLVDVDDFIAWANSQPDDLAARPITYGQTMPFLEMLAGTAQHITWHAAAVHYWTKWRSPERVS